MTTVAALYVDPAGAYANLPGVEVWDEARDARLYDGPWPVVAHPPCARWSIMGICRGYYDGDDGGCFARALASVRRFGGVLEHPAHTLAWRTFCLARPPREGWTRSLLDDGWTCQVDQGLYGHRMRKLTWLYYHGPSPPELRWGDGGRGELTVANLPGSDKSLPGSDKSRKLRTATPPEFRDVLLAMARSASRVETAELAAHRGEAHP